METYVADPRIDAFCSVIVYGQSNCGKSHLSVSVALQRDKVFKQRHSKCIIFMQYPQKLFLDARERDNSIVLVRSIEELEAELIPKTLLICDDFMLASYSSANSMFVSKLFMERSHHEKITLVFQAQLLFSRTGRPWSLNASHFIFFKSHNDSNIQRFFRNFGNDADFLYEAYKKATTNRPYGHFFVSFHPKTDNNLRFRSNIIAEEGVEIYNRLQND